MSIIRMYWVEISYTIELAWKLIYIVRWASKNDITLLRIGKNDEQFGALLKQKADAEVTVLVFIWDKLFSNDILPGLMLTHDEETYEYFLNSNMKYLKVPRRKDEASVFEKQFIKTAFSYHQKYIILDAEIKIEGSAMRKLVTFQGDLNISYGRWDTFKHPLFRTLFTDHKGDFYNR